jgi:hypothetical protein
MQQIDNQNSQPPTTSIIVVSKWQTNEADKADAYVVDDGFKLIYASECLRVSVLLEAVDKVC